MKRPKMKIFTTTVGLNDGHLFCTAASKYLRLSDTRFYASLNFHLHYLSASTKTCFIIDQRSLRHPESVCFFFPSQWPFRFCLRGNVCLCLSLSYYVFTFIQMLSCLICFCMFLYSNCFHKDPIFCSDILNVISSPLHTLKKKNIFLYICIQF